MVGRSQFVRGIKFLNDLKCLLEGFASFLTHNGFSAVKQYAQFGIEVFQSFLKLP